MEKIDSLQTENQNDVANEETEISLETLDEVNGGGGVRILWGLIDVQW